MKFMFYFLLITIVLMILTTIPSVGKSEGCYISHKYECV